MTDVISIPFQQAVLCMDCDQVTKSVTDCVVCGSKALLLLSAALQEQPETYGMADSAKVLLQSYYERKAEHKQQISVEADSTDSNSVS